SKTRALDTGAELRERITEHERVMVINDEAHHVWDPGSSWNEAIRSLHDTIRKRSGGSLVAQLDFSATPKDNSANYFKHIVCDTPLGEAVDAGIVKTPIIGRAGKLTEQATENAAYRYEAHLKLGYERWLLSKEEWFPSGKKPLLFVMCENTEAANDIATRLNGDAVFKELNGRTINLHTRLKGKIKQEGKGKDKRSVFVVDEKDISDDDLRELRKLSRDLDSDSSPYYCIVSVLMLREGWDVRNVTTIVPLRPYSSKANILPEQTLGRGLRRMTPPGQANEVVTVIEHEAFARLYQEELAQEGLALQVVEVNRIPATTISIFPDSGNKDLDALAIDIPGLSAANMVLPALSPIAEAEVRAAFQKYRPLPIGEAGSSEVQYEGRHLITGELVEQMKVNLTLLDSGMGAISFFIRELEYICRVRNTHQVLAPLLQVFFEEILFGPGKSIFEPDLVRRLSDADVREYVRATFVPIIRARTVQQETRASIGSSMSLGKWRPFQVTHSERRPVEQSSRTLFNLVPCDRSLEVAFVDFCTRAPDVAAFAKNAGPQALRIDYLAAGGRLAFYAPDFFIRSQKGAYYLVETKGQFDAETAAKARAAVEWCRAASEGGPAWTYVFIPEGVFQRFTGDTIEALERTCYQSLVDLTEPDKYRQELPLFATLGPTEDRLASRGVIDEKVLDQLPPRARKAAEDATELFLFLEGKTEPSFGAVFTPFLAVFDDLARAILTVRLSPRVPAARQAQLDWFDPHIGNVNPGQRSYYQRTATNLRKTLVDNAGTSPIGLLRSCLDYALNDNTKLGGVFEALKSELRFAGGRNLLAQVDTVNTVRNKYVAHEYAEMDAGQVRKTLQEWVSALAMFWKFAQSPAAAA
ncbi:MAG: DEAD/DEAH box helicase, partial [Tepidiformaceae bacterium]